MSRALRCLGVAALVAGFGLAGAVNVSSAAAPPDRSEAIARAERALTQAPGLAKVSSYDEFQVRRVTIGADGSSDVRFDRSYRGLPVLGGDFVVHHDGTGGLTGVSLAQDQAVSLDTTPAIGAAAAKAAARKHFRGTAGAPGAPRLVVDAGPTGSEHRLGWETVVTGTKADGQTPSRLHVITDADTGALLFRTDEVMGGGDGVHVGQVDLSTTGSSGNYQLTDSAHGNGYTCDLNNGTSNCPRMTDADDAWGNGQASNDQSAAVDAHFGAAKTFDYFKNVHGRNGIFGDGRGVPSRVHYGNAYANAFWDGSQMTYGDGANNSNPLTAIDVAGHEMAHGVTQALAGLCYDNTDCGGLNEATSDIFGTMTEFYANLSEDRPDYDIGEKINIRGDGKPLRYMYKPSLDGRSFDCYQAGRQADPHYSSGIGNHFFFLLSEGSGSTPFGTSPTCDGSTVTGIGRDKAAAIWYKALDEEFVSRTQYPDARKGTLSAATELYGECSTEYQGVLAAWKGVNVTGNEQCAGNPADPTAAFTANCSTTEQSCSFDASASKDPDGSISSYSWKFGDSQTGTGVNPSHTYAQAGTYTVELTVTDNSGKTDTETKQVTAGKPPTTGQPPRASFTVQCQWATCSFNGSGSTDPDNDIASYTWTYGDGQTGTGVTSSHSYPNVQRTYTAQLKVTDRTGNTNTASKQIQCWSVGTQAFCFAQ